MVDLLKVYAAVILTKRQTEINMKNYVYVLSLLIVAACTQDKIVDNEVTQKVQKDDARIANYMKSVRLASFYIADPTDPSTKEDDLTPASLTAFTKKSKLYTGGKLAQLSVSDLKQQYNEFVKTNASDPRIRRFRRETAEALLARAEPMTITDRAYFTNELIASRSDDVALICKSVLVVRSKLSPSEQTRLLAETHKLLNQYEKSFSDELAQYQGKPGTTYLQKATYALNTEFARQGLALVRDNQRLLGNVE